MKVDITYITPPQDLLRGYNNQNSGTDERIDKDTIEQTQGPRKK